MNPDPRELLGLARRAAHEAGALVRNAPWDFAAGALIAREGGADVRGAELDEPRGELLVASAPSITADLYRVLS